MAASGENGSLERLNGNLCEGLLNCKILYTLLEVRVLIGRPSEFNNYPPHTAPSAIACRHRRISLLDHLPPRSGTYSRHLKIR
jgi:hypothetical protein